MDKNGLDFSVAKITPITSYHKFTVCRGWVFNPGHVEIISSAFFYIART